MVGHSLWKASGVDSDQTLPVRIAKHDPLDTAKDIVGVSIALGSKYACCPAAFPERISVTTHEPLSSWPQVGRRSRLW